MYWFLCWPLHDARGFRFLPRYRTSLVDSQRILFCNHGEPSDDDIEQVAKRCLLPVSEVSLWINHLQTVDRNRKRGAAKAAASRKSKKNPAPSTTPQEEEYYCGVCEGLYGASEDEYWIACDGCDNWFHGDCVHVTKETEPDEFFCSKCVHI